MPQKSRPTRAQGVDSARPQSRRGQNATSGKRGQLCGFAVLRDHFTLVSSVLSARVVVRRPLGREAGKKEKLKFSFTSLLNSSRRASEGEAVLSPGRLGTSVPRAGAAGESCPPGKRWGTFPRPREACGGARPHSTPFLHATQLDRKCCFLRGTISHPRLLVTRHGRQNWLPPADSWERGPEAIFIESSSHPLLEQDK